MQYIKITLLTRDGLHEDGCFVDLPGNVDIPALFDGAPEGEKFLLESIEMEPEEYAKLEEFTGF